ncbi:MAG: HAD family hydrolase [Mogibacterium sp.]|nr:HAD family hydrolase [Mogibacterium sp.]
MKKKHVVFDFDGTLLNTDEIIVDSWQAVFLHYTGESGDEETILKSFGEPLRKTARTFFPEEELEGVVEYYRSYQNENYEGRIALFPGVEGLVMKLRSLGYTTSIVTSRTRLTTDEYVDLFGIRELFDVIITCDDVTAHKPDPAPLLKALDLLGASPEEAIMLGDSKYDIGCANNAGVDSVLVTWGHPGSEEEMAALGFAPTARIAEPEELFRLL